MSSLHLPAINFRIYRLPDKDCGPRYRSLTYDRYDRLALPCRNIYLKVYIQPRVFTGGSKTCPDPRRHNRKDTMETEIILDTRLDAVLNPEAREKKIEAVMHNIRLALENAYESLPRLQERLEDSMARAALGEDNHTQIARIKRQIADLKRTIRQTPLVITGLKRMKQATRAAESRDVA